MEDEKKDFDPEKLLDELINNYNKYFVDSTFCSPTTRYEAWLMASCLANLLTARMLKKAIGDLFELLRNPDVNIFQKQQEPIIIKDKIPEVKTEENLVEDPQKTSLKRRKRG